MAVSIWSSNWFEAGKATSKDNLVDTNKDNTPEENMW